MNDLHCFLNFSYAVSAPLLHLPTAIVLRLANHQQVQWLVCTLAVKTAASKQAYIIRYSISFLMTTRDREQVSPDLWDLGLDVMDAVAFDIVVSCTLSHPS
jgi:hypothetical protein